MRKCKQIYLTLFFALNLILACPLPALAKQVADLPFSGYFMPSEDHAVEGLLFEDNQVYIYVKDSQHHDPEGNQAQGQDLLAHLEELHSFPYPDLKNYSPQVRDVYLEEGNLPYDLKEEYQAITDQIQPDMSQEDILNLINNHIPGIYYTHKDGYQYYILASPSIEEKGSAWQIRLFGQDIIELEEESGNLMDQEGTIYERVDGIKPN